MRPIDLQNKNEIPILFIHGENDTFIGLIQAQDMYDRDRGKKALCLIPGAGHAESILKATDAYKSQVAEFLQSLA